MLRISWVIDTTGKARDNGLSGYFGSSGNRPKQAENDKNYVKSWHKIDTKTREM
jgi:hypothetical protein